MRKQRIAIGSALTAMAASLVACGDDTLLAPIDAGPDASIASDASIPETGSLDALEETAQDAADEVVAVAPPPPRLLLSNGASMNDETELAVFGVQSEIVDGRLRYPGAIGTAATTTSSAWLLEQANDVVARLDPLQPWVVRSSWNVALRDAIDAGAAPSYAEPDAIVVGAGTKAYVLRYMRNVIAVIDTSEDVDGGAPAATIDLSSQLQSEGDGVVEMTAGYYDPESGYVFVLLGNIDRSNVAPDGSAEICSNTHPTVVAIDPSTDMLVPLQGNASDDGGGSAGYALQGYAPVAGAAMVYDSPHRRLLVLERGCNLAGTDGGVGAVARRMVEAVSLADGTVTSLLDLSSQGVPSGIFYVDSHHVIVQLQGVAQNATPDAIMWDPASSALGSPIPHAPSVFTLDGQGNLLGLTQSAGDDGGARSFAVVSVNPSDGGSTLLGPNPFDLPAGVVGPVVLWPPP